MLPMLTLREPDADVRERFLSGRTGADEIAREPVLVRWERVRTQRLLADGNAQAQAEGVNSAQLSARRERLAGLLCGQSPLLEPLTKDLASPSLVAVVADHEGVVLYRHGAGAFPQTTALTHLVEGAHWSEAARGTNAVGAVLVERRPVAVIGGAHFEAENAGIFCYASPVFDPRGELICVLDASGPMTLHDPAVGVAVRSAASVLELVLRTQAFDRAVVGGLGTLARVIERLHEPAFVVDIRGQLLCGNMAARSVLDDLGQHSDDAVLGRQLSAWQLAAMREGKITASGRAHSYALTLDPLCGSDGLPIALLVIANPVAKVPSRPPSRPPCASTRTQLAGETDAFCSLLGIDLTLIQEKARAEVYARTDLPVLLLAETGTGKELFARAIHAASPRSRGAFVAINCGALPPTLLESELFGHAPHAFTGASHRGSEGKVSAAHGGTLFLDEVGDMPTALQALLLRFLDDGTYYRVGDSQPRKANVRIVCATCRDLPARVRSGEFRQDLFYRIQGACVTSPPLRKRTDRVWLAQQLLAAQGGSVTLMPCAEQYIASHSWPGNVRELKSALLHARALAPGLMIERSHFSRPLLSEPINEPEQPEAASPSEVRPRALVLRDAVDEALRLTNGNLSEAARRLRMARSTLYRILRRNEQSQ